MALLGIYEVDKTFEVPCLNMKEKWLKYLFENPYITTKCKPVDPVGCIKSKDLTKLFSSTFELIKEILLKFGFKVTIGQLGYNKDVLNIFRKVFQKFSFIQEAVDQISSLINSKNQIDHELLVETSDIRPKKKCKDLLDLKKVCKEKDPLQEEKSCLSEEEALGLLNYILLYHMIDTKTQITQKKFDGNFNGFIIINRESYTLLNV